MRWLASVRSQTFQGPSQFAELMETCNQDSANTKLVTLKSAAELLLRPDGRTVAGYRFNTIAFQLATQYISQGLGTLCRNLWSSDKVKEQTRQSVIVDIYNSSVKLRGKSLRGLRLVLDERDGVVVGVVGRNYRYISNAELLQLVRSKFSGREEYRLVTGKLWNRDLALISIQSDRRSKVKGVEFRQGLAVFNSETTRQAIFLPKVVFDNQSRGYSFQPESRRTRLIHRKSKQFSQQLDTMLIEAFRSDELLTEVAAQCAILCGQQCIPPGRESEAKKHIASRLETRGVGAIPTTRVLELLVANRDPSKWDVYQSLVRSASEFRGSERLLRMTAYNFLMRGKL